MVTVRGGNLTYGLAGLKASKGINSCVAVCNVHLMLGHIIFDLNGYYRVKGVLPRARLASLSRLAHI